MRHDVRFLSNGLTIAGHLYIPDVGATTRRLAIVIGHMMGGVKEQSPMIYAERLLREGFIALTFDAAHWGESAGEPRLLEDPFQRSEDVRAAVSFLTTREEVDPEHIGALGICASGGYVPFASQTDHRIKAVATVSAVCIGRMFRFGVDGKQREDAILPMLKEAAADRNNEARGYAARKVALVPTTEEAAGKFPPNSMFHEAYSYYCTPRGQHPRSVGQWVPRSIDRLSQYDSFELIRLISPRPLLMIAGTKADTAHFSSEAIGKAQEPKELFWIEGATHIDLYDKEPYVPIAVKKLSEFFKKHLAAKNVGHPAEAA